MKILGIRFQNLNSLKGTFEIRFDKSPFLESGLFAITGATGAGKTTILDAITVALYGRVHRHDRDAFEIMTRHTTECYAEVEFEVKQKAYRAQWALRRSRGKVDGKLQDVKMTLSQVSSGQILESKLTETKARIIELTGLDYNQFLRSVMLSQGDFTRFLKASEGERSELLEKITDTGIYSDISVWAFEKAKSEKKELDILRGQLNEVELIETEDLMAYQARREELHYQEISLRQVKTENEKKVNWLQTIQKLHQKKSQAYVQLQAQLALQQEQRPAFQKLQAHQKAIVFKPALTEIQTNLRYINQIIQTLASLTEALPELQERAEQATIDLQNAQLQATTAEKNWQEAQPVIERIIQLDATIGHTRTSYEQTLEAAGLLTSETGQQQKEIQDKKEALHELNAAFVYTQNWLAQHENEACLEKELSIFERYITDLIDIERRQQKLLEEKGYKEKEIISLQTIVGELTRQQETLNQTLTHTSTEKLKLQTQLTELLGIKSVADLEAEMASLPSLISLCEIQVSLSHQYSLFIERRLALHTQLATYQQTLAQKEEALKQFETQKAAAEIHLKDLQNLVELQMRIQKYEADRETLLPDTPCPLCGSTHHPFTQSHPKNQVSEAEKKRDTYQHYLISLADQLSQTATQVTTLQTRIAGEREQIQVLDKEIQATTQTFGFNNSRLPKPLEIEKPTVIEAVCRRKSQDLEGIQTQLTQIRTLENQLKTLEATLGQQREELVKHTGQIKQIAGTETHLQQLLTRIADELQDLNEQQTNITGEAHSFLLQFDLRFDYGQTDQLVTALRNRAQEYNLKSREFRELQLTQAQSQADLEKAMEAIETKKQLLATQQKTIQQQLATLKVQEDERRELFGLKNPTTEQNQLQETLRGKNREVEALRQTLQNFQEQLKLNQEQQAERTKELNKLQNQEIAFSQKLQNQLISQGIDSVEALEHLFLAEEEADRLNQLQCQIGNNVAAYERLLKTTEEELQHEQARQLTTEPESNLRLEITHLESESSLLNREIGRIEQLLQRDAQLKAQHQVLAQKIEVQQKEFIRWDKLATLIGSADGKKFSKFAQGLTLARLVMLANQHLLKINKRYRILKNPQQDLDLQIVDTYQADAVRPMSTLSGGESFLVSLALALGLSDLAGRQAQIGSLFIDEGFGTLDVDTLDTAITSLENLQASGKMIGIISHVEALKERISTQVQVVKMAGGMSKLKIVGHATDAYA